MNYVKYIDENTIKYAPVNFAGVSNFNQDTDLMRAHGFKELIETTRPDDGRVYRFSYVENENTVLVVWEEIMLDPTLEPTYAELRAAAYPDMTEQLDKLYHDIDGGLFGDTAKTSAFYLARKEVKETYPKVAESEVS